MRHRHITAGQQVAAIISPGRRRRWTCSRPCRPSRAAITGRRAAWPARASCRAAWPRLLRLLLPLLSLLRRLRRRKRKRATTRRKNRQPLLLLLRLPRMLKTETSSTILVLLCARTTMRSGRTRSLLPPSSRWSIEVPPCSGWIPRRWPIPSTAASATRPTRPSRPPPMPRRMPRTISRRTPRRTPRTIRGWTPPAIRPARIPCRASRIPTRTAA
mmetsp:Transcript_32077/g.94419  ORF Transcript_32077/g.94419 Transcript_32077/m.94419 type:complete len:215 (+) Transcript_32077:29-673(+)